MKRPLQSGFLPVDSKHRLYFEVVGNPRGKRVVFFHGGPGTGFAERHRDRFDLKRLQVLFFDQRGAGRSLPRGSLQRNTTRHLVDDTKKILDHVGWEKAILYGGSWGATLALAFAVKHPKSVQAMFLQSTYLATDLSLEYFIGEQARARVPQAWDRVVAKVPKRLRRAKQIVSWYLRQMQLGSKSKRRDACYRWCEYECSLLRLEPDAEGIRAALQDFPYEVLAPIEAHYMAKRCFLPKDYFLSRANQLKKIPAVFVHGRYDQVCPPGDAFDLHQAMPKSKFHWALAGHSGDAALKDVTAKGWNELLKRISR